MNYTKHFDKHFNAQFDYLMRHFRTSFKRRLARFLLGDKAIYNLFYDSAQVGWGIGFSVKDNKGS